MYLDRCTTWSEHISKRNTIVAYSTAVRAREDNHCGSIWAYLKIPMAAKAISKGKVRPQKPLDFWFLKCSDSWICLKIQCLHIHWIIHGGRAGATPTQYTAVYPLQTNQRRDHYNSMSLSSQICMKSAYPYWWDKLLWISHEYPATQLQWLLIKCCTATSSGMAEKVQSAGGKKSGTWSPVADGNSARNHAKHHQWSSDIISVILSVSSLFILLISSYIFLCYYHRYWSTSFHVFSCPSIFGHFCPSPLGP